MYLNEGWIDWPATKTKPYPEPWQQTLLEAAQYIRTRGWCQGRYGGHGDTPACLVGAILASTDERENVDKFNENFTSATVPVKSLVGSNIVAWNDTCGRRLTEVLDALEKAANY